MNFWPNWGSVYDNLFASVLWASPIALLWAFRKGIEVRRRMREAQAKFDAAKLRRLEYEQALVRGVQELEAPDKRVAYFFYIVLELERRKADIYFILGVLITLVGMQVVYVASYILTGDSVMMLGSMLFACGMLYFMYLFTDLIVRLQRLHAAVSEEVKQWSY